MTKAKSMPTVRQLISMYVDQAVDGLEYLKTIGRSDAGWDNVDDEIDLAVELALIRARQLKAANPDAGSFDLEWFRVKAAINLCTKSFSRSDSHYGRWLKRLDELFAHAAIAVEYAARRAAGEA